MKCSVGLKVWSRLGERTGVPVSCRRAAPDRVPGSSSGLHSAALTFLRRRPFGGVVGGVLHRFL